MSIRCTSVQLISRFVASSRLPTPAHPLLQAQEAELLHVESVPADRHRRIPFKLAIEIRDSSFCPSHPRRELVFFNQTFGEAVDQPLQRMLQLGSLRS
jgi:hypothetical protein